MVTKAEELELVSAVKQSNVTFRSREQGYLTWLHAVEDLVRMVAVGTARRWPLVALVAIWAPAFALHSIPFLVAPPLAAASTALLYLWASGDDHEGREGRVRLVGDVVYADRELDPGSLWDHSVMHRELARKRIRDRHPWKYTLSHVFFFLPVLHGVRAEIEYRVAGQQMVAWRNQDGDVPTWMLIELAGRLCGPGTLWAEVPWRRNRAIYTLQIISDDVGRGTLRDAGAPSRDWSDAIRRGRNPTGPEAAA